MTTLGVGSECTLSVIVEHYTDLGSGGTLLPYYLEISVARIGATQIVEFNFAQLGQYYVNYGAFLELSKILKMYLITEDKGYITK